MPGAYAPGYAGYLVFHPIVQFYARTVTSVRFRTNGISAATRHRPELRSLSADSTIAQSPAHTASNLGGAPHTQDCHTFFLAPHASEKTADTAKIAKSSDHHTGVHTQSED